MFPRVFWSAALTTVAAGILAAIIIADMVQLNTLLMFLKFN
jgi:hypothetical protein